MKQFANKIDPNNVEATCEPDRGTYLNPLHF